MSILQLSDECLHDAKLEFCCEPYGGPWRQDDVMPLVDQVMVEFWTRQGNFKTQFNTIAASRKSGQNIVEAEAFTGSPADSMWSETPAWLKPIGDAAYCAGINRFILHHYVHQPWDDRYKPGVTMGLWGTHFERTQTWWKPFHATISYWQRCQAMLQWGKFANVTGDFSTDMNQPGGLELRAIHRAKDGRDVYFVANINAAASGTAKCTFLVSGKQPELLDPVWGTRRNLPEFEQHDGKIIIPLEFAPGQSYFIVFRHPVEGNPQPVKRNFPVFKPVVRIAGPWQVSFDPKWGGPAEPVMFASLEDWTNRTEPGIRYYSGTAMYRTTFDASAGSRLKLGIVNHLAKIRLNGRDLGVVWLCAMGG